MIWFLNYQAWHIQLMTVNRYHLNYECKTFHTWLILKHKIDEFCKIFYYIFSFHDVKTLKISTEEIYSNHKFAAGPKVILKIDLIFFHVYHFSSWEGLESARHWKGESWRFRLEQEAEWGWNVVESSSSHSSRLVVKCSHWNFWKHKKPFRLDGFECKSILSKQNKTQ